jgi:hypothetical protein
MAGRTGITGTIGAVIIGIGRTGTAATGTITTGVVRGTGTTGAAGNVGSPTAPPGPTGMRPEQGAGDVVELRPAVNAIDGPHAELNDPPR